MTQATPRPWKQSIYNPAIIEDRNNEFVCATSISGHFESAVADAALIVRAVNYHDGLVEMLKSLFEFIENDFSNRETGPDEASCRDCTHGTTPDHLHKGPCAYHRARALLARIEQDKDDGHAS